MLSSSHIPGKNTHEHLKCHHGMMGANEGALHDVPSIQLSLKTCLILWSSHFSPLVHFCTPQPVPCLLFFLFSFSPCPSQGPLSKGQPDPKRRIAERSGCLLRAEPQQCQQTLKLPSCGAHFVLLLFCASEHTQEVGWRREENISSSGYIKLTRGTLYCELAGARGVKGHCRPAETECFKPGELCNVQWKEQKCGFESPREVKLHLLSEFSFRMHKFLHEFPGNQSVLYNFRVRQPLALEPPRGHIIIGVNPFIHHRGDTSGVWKHGMMLHHSCGEKCCVLWKLQGGIR